MTDGTTTWDYTYDANGMRKSRTDGTTTYEYIYDGSTLRQMNIGDNYSLYFIYDADGPMALNETSGTSSTTYYYVKNAQGDITAIVNKAGTAVVEYYYDAWGNLLSIEGDYKNGLGIRNPLRYRGYVYDTETGLYYLQSRYYDSQIGRFINADSYASTGQGIIGYNMFAYCNNRPIMLTDHSGMSPWLNNVVAINDCGGRQREVSSLELILEALAAPDKDGCTFSAGISVGYTEGGVSQGLSSCISADSSNNYALQGTTSYGSATGAGFSSGLTMTYTNANSVQDLAGFSEATGGSLCYLGGIAIDYITFVPSSDPDRTCWGISVTISGGAEFEAHINNNYTYSSKSWNLWKALKEFIY